MTSASDPAELLAHADSLRAFVRSLVRDDHEAEDVLQSTWTVAMTADRSRIASPRSWLFGVARNVFRASRRTEARRTRRESVRGEPDPPCDPAAVAERVDLLQTITAEALALDEPYRTAVLLRFFESRTPEEIAAQMDVPVATARTRVHRGLQQIREAMDAQAPDWRAALALFVAPRAARVPPATKTATPVAATAALVVVAVVIAVTALSVRPERPRPPSHTSAASPTPPAPRARIAEVAPSVEPSAARATAAAPLPAVSVAPPVRAADPPPPAATAAPPAPRTSAQSDLSAIPRYEPPQPAPEGVVRSKGSDTLNNTMTFCAEAFLSRFPQVKIVIEGRGSSTAPPALAEGKADIGPMSRDMRREEADAIRARLGEEARRVAIGRHAIAVFVHCDNPLTQLTLAQLDAIYSSTRKRGAAAITTWGDLGLTGEWRDQPINVYGRNSASGEYGYFKEVALRKGDFRNTVSEQPGAATIVQRVDEDRFGIGYAGAGSATDRVRAVPLVPEQPRPGEDAAVPASDPTYPLRRTLWICFVGGRLPLAAREFLRFIVSREGQECVAKDGYEPLDAAAAAEARRELER